jgi:hypothetical protein
LQQKFQEAVKRFEREYSHVVGQAKNEISKYQAELTFRQKEIYRLSQENQNQKIIIENLSLKGKIHSVKDERKVTFFFFFFLLFFFLN